VRLVGFQYTSMSIIIVNEIVWKSTEIFCYNILIPLPACFDIVN